MSRGILERPIWVYAGGSKGRSDEGDIFGNWTGAAA